MKKNARITCRFAFLPIWKEDVEDFLDDANPGMKKFLQEVSMQAEGVKEEWLVSMSRVYGEKITGDGVKVWRALKGLTEGEARKVLNAVKSENGFEAWRQLHLRFEPELEAQKNTVLMDLHNIADWPWWIYAESEDGSAARLPLRVICI